MKIKVTESDLSKIKISPSFHCFVDNPYDETFIRSPIIIRAKTESFSLWEFWLFRKIGYNNKQIRDLIKEIGEQRAKECLLMYLVNHLLL